MLMVIKSSRLREIISIPGILLGWIFLSSAEVTPASWLSILNKDVACFFVILTSVFGSVELLMKIASFFLTRKKT